MITRIGHDPLGASIVADFERHGLATDGPATGCRCDPTGTVTVHMVGTRHTFEIGADSAWDHLDAARAVRDVQALAPAVIYFGTLAQRGAVSRAAIEAALDATPAVPFLDLNLRDGPRQPHPGGRVADARGAGQGQRCRARPAGRLVHPSRRTGPGLGRAGTTRRRAGAGAALRPAAHDDHAWRRRLGLRRRGRPVARRPGRARSRFETPSVPAMRSPRCCCWVNCGAGRCRSRCSARANTRPPCAASPVRSIRAAASTPPRGLRGRWIPTTLGDVFPLTVDTALHQMCR